MNPEFGHLYHDSHFTATSGGALDAREQLRAREVNAREQRLLRMNDSLLDRAKDICQKRSRWEQDNIRRQLRNILERTPTFTRTLENEKERLRRRREYDFYNNKSKGGYQRTGRGRRGPRAAVALYPHDNPPRSNRLLLPPLPASQSLNTPHHGVYGKDVTSHSSPADFRGQQRNPLWMPVENQSPMRVVADGKQLQNKPWRYREFDNHHSSQNNVASPDTPEDSTRTAGSLVSSDMTSSSVVTSHKGADLRRRSHHAVMAIVRVQTRHEQRMREAEMEMALWARRKFGTQLKTVPEPVEIAPEMTSETQILPQL